MIKGSFILPVKNGEKFIAKTLKSLVNQTIKDIEIIVVNDHSTDDTENILRSLAKVDSRIKIWDLPNNIRGVSAARNFGADKARGEIILPTDADDPNKLNRAEVSINELEKNRADIFYATLEHHYLDTGKISRRFFQEYDAGLLRYINYINHAGASAYKKKLFLKLKGYDTKIEIGEDYDLWLRAQEAGAKFCSKEMVLAEYSRYQGQTTKAPINTRHLWLRKIRQIHSIFEIDFSYIKEHANKETYDYFMNDKERYEIWFGKNSLPKKHL